MRRQNPWVEIITLPCVSFLVWPNRPSSLCSSCKGSVGSAVVRFYEIWKNTWLRLDSINIYPHQRTDATYFQTWALHYKIAPLDNNSPIASQI